ncbi:MAG: hypothetical protein PHF67_05660 [Candidatus Nanoarchaeia archaeon]|nr:hypothetical protein [Candidatus Nanoarchaeia archaeon]
MAVDEIFSFEEFSAREDGHPRYNDFYRYWESEESILGMVYRKKPHALRFQQEHSDLDKILQSKISNMAVTRSTSEALKPFDRDLYEAYVIMRGFGVPNKDLFS